MDWIPMPALPASHPLVRRHGWLVAVLLLVVLAYFGVVAWVGHQLGADLAHTVQLAPSVADQQHRRD